MSSAIDTNIIGSLWDRDPTNLAARNALDAAMNRGPLVVCGVVYAELMAGGRRPAMLDEFFDGTGVSIDWAMDRQIWERAGLAYQGYVERRRKNREEVPKSILADFLIGAHACRHGHTLLTLDERTLRAAFPELRIVRA